MTRKGKMLLVSLAILALVMLAYKVTSDGSSVDPNAGIVMLKQARALPSIQLIDQTGKTVDISRLQGRWHLLFLGYTFCPDICPVTLVQLRDIYDRLPEELQARLDVVFVSVDPERDTLDRINQYLAFFHERFWGMTGTRENLQAFSQAVNIPFIPPDTRQPGYSIDHSGNLAIIGPDGMLRGFVRAPLNVVKLAENLPRVLTD